MPRGYSNLDIREPPVGSQTTLVAYNIHGTRTEFIITNDGRVRSRPRVSSMDASTHWRSYPDRAGIPYLGKDLGGQAVVVRFLVTSSEDLDGPGGSPDKIRMVTVHSPAGSLLYQWRAHFLEWEHAADSKPCPYDRACIQRLIEWAGLPSDEPYRAFNPDRAVRCICRGVGYLVQLNTLYPADNPQPLKAQLGIRECTGCEGSTILEMQEALQQLKEKMPAAAVHTTAHIDLHDSRLVTGS